MTSLLLALSGAVLYGLSDFLGGLASRRTSPWAVAMVSAFAAAVLVLVASFFVEGSPDATSLWWAALAGVGNGFGTSFLYRGLSSGRMGVVAPISAVGAAVVPVAAGLAGGERPGAVVWLGILMALPGIWFVSREPDLADGPVPRRCRRRRARRAGLRHPVRGARPDPGVGRPPPAGVQPGRGGRGHRRGGPRAPGRRGCRGSGRPWSACGAGPWPPARPAPSWSPPSRAS